MTCQLIAKEVIWRSTQQNQRCTLNVALSVIGLLLASLSLGRRVGTGRPAKIVQLPASPAKDPSALHY
eukprot:5115489-Pleurochrysis_carterae.AAC.1